MRIEKNGSWSSGSFSTGEVEWIRAWLKRINSGLYLIGDNGRSSNRRPGRCCSPSAVLEIFCNLHNDFSPPEEINSRVTGKQSYRFQRIFADMVLVNLGGVRAETVTFRTSGSFKRRLLNGEEPAFFQSTIWQMAPGQSHYLMRVDHGDLHDWPPDEKTQNAKRMAGIKKDTLTIIVQYDGPATILNRITRSLRRWRGLKQYETQFIFDPQIFAGDLPPPNYA